MSLLMMKLLAFLPASLFPLIPKPKTYSSALSAPPIPSLLPPPHRGRLFPVLFSLLRSVLKLKYIAFFWCFFWGSCDLSEYDAFMHACKCVCVCVCVRARAYVY